MSPKVRRYLSSKFDTYYFDTLEKVKQCQTLNELNFYHYQVNTLISFFTTELKVFSLGMYLEYVSRFDAECFGVYEQIVNNSANAADIPDSNEEDKSSE